jgi:hypothetical protein
MGLRIKQNLAAVDAFRDLSLVERDVDAVAGPSGITDDPSLPQTISRYLVAAENVSAAESWNRKRDPLRKRS